MDKSYFIDEKTVVSKDNVLFKISDIVTIKDNKSPNYGKLLTILGFRWNKSETEICAITNIHIPSGIGIDKIKHIINNEETPKRISFYVKYTEEFTEDLYNALWEWSKKNSKFSPRKVINSYKELKIHKFYVFDNWTLGSQGKKYGGIFSEKYSYGVNNNSQNCEKEYTIEQVKKLIGYKEPNVEFIPGKWYKLIDCENTYRKCSDHPIKNRLPYSELISGRGHQFSYGNCNELKRLKLVEDLSEIQEYLPEGHVDKFCETCNGEGETMVAKLYPSGHTEVTDTCPDCNGTGFNNNNIDKITSDKFKKGDYIVLIGNGQSTGNSTSVQTDSYIHNHCYKVRENNTFLRAELDSDGSTTSGWECIPYNPNKFHKTRNWRYATEKESIEYERRGEPYNVNELTKTTVFSEINRKELDTDGQVTFLPQLKNNKYKKMLTIDSIHSVDTQLKIKKKTVKF